MEWCPTVPDGRAALSLRIARGVAVDIRAGRLRPGDRLPGARTLAARLGVHRNTVAAAWRELVAEGWLVSTPRGGMRVAPGVGPQEAAGASGGVGIGAAGPRRGRGRRGGAVPGGASVAPVPDRASSPGFALPEVWLPRAPEVDPPGALILHGGKPDLRLLPLPALGRAWRRALAGSGRSLVDYGDPRGHRALRDALARWLRAHRALPVDGDGLVVTRGSQHALHLVARACFAPGSRVAVESFGYSPAWAAFRLAGVEPVPVPVDGEGIDVDALARLDVAGVYVTPHHQYPTMVGLSPRRRASLLAWAAARRVPVVEDDYDHEFHFAGAPRLPLRHADPDGVVVYVGTLAKALAPGLRIGFVVAGAEVLRRVERLRVAIDRQGDLVTERAVAELLDEGEVERHVARMRRVYAERGRALAGLVTEHLGVPTSPPEGGLALWVRSPVDAEVLQARCLARGVGFRIGSEYTFDGRRDPHLRLGFANLDVAELTRALGVVGEETRA